MTVDPAAAARFAADWHAATGTGVADRALVALSGGPDSVALLILLASVRGIQPPLAATVDHGLRAASSAEAGRAADIARRCGVGHAILRGDLPERAERTANLSARARALRYRLLEAHAEAVGARWIVTAHHADDQLETMLMRLNRGAGVRGVSGIRRSGGRLVRPLLGWRRTELAAVVRGAGITAINDPSNVDDRFDRARLRKLLGEVDWLDPAAFARSAAALAEADAAVEWAADQAADRYLERAEGVAIVRYHLLPAELRRRLLERALAHVDPGPAPAGGDLSRLLAGLHAERSGTIGRALVEWNLAGWIVRPAPPRRTPAANA